jgi:hypothetical protein
MTPQDIKFNKKPEEKNGTTENRISAKTNQKQRGRVHLRVKKLIRTFPQAK